MPEQAAPDTSRLRAMAKAALSTDDRDNPWDWLEGASPNWQAIEGRVDLYFWQRFDAKVNGYHTTFIGAASPLVVLSLLDRIEELEAEVAQLAMDAGRWQPPYKPMSPEVRAILDKYRV